MPIFFKVKLPSWQTTSGLSGVKDEELLTGRAILQPRNIGIPYFQQLNLEPKQGIRRNTIRDAAGAVGQVGCYDQSPDTTNTHTFNAASQTSNKLSLAEVNLNVRFREQLVGQFRPVIQKDLYLHDHSLSSLSLTPSAEDDILDLYSFRHMLWLWWIFVLLHDHTGRLVGSRRADSENPGELVVRNPDVIQMSV